MRSTLWRAGSHRLFYTKEDHITHSECHRGWPYFVLYVVREDVRELCDHVHLFWVFIGYEWCHAGGWASGGWGDSRPGLADLLGGD